MFKDKKVAHIVAMGLNGEIGGNNELLWHIPEDLRFFKEMTIGRVIVMGRKTIESLPKSLPRRITLGVSRNGWPSSYSDKDILYARLNSALEMSEIINSDKIFIAGGASLYNATFDVTDELYVTHVEHTFPAADTFYAIPEGFEYTGDIIPSTQSLDGLKYRVSKYERKSK